MSLPAKKVLHIDLSNDVSEVKSYPDLAPYVGGVGIGLKLYEMYSSKDPLIFSVGPLNGFFPFVSKTSVILDYDGVVEDIYLGGSLSYRLAFGCVDAIVISGKAKSPVVLDVLNDAVSIKKDAVDLNALGLPGKRSVLVTAEKAALVDGYFTTAENLLGHKMAEKNIKAMVVTGTQVVTVPNVEKYSTLYKDILGRSAELEVSMSSNPSCSGCPMGCKKSRVGEIGGNVLGHCLTSCEYAKRIYSDVNIVFSCLNVLGYDYTHEDLEKVPGMIETLLTKL